jgi:hypothetical protein
MRNFLAFVGAAVVVFLALGWYLGWYNITPEKTGPGQSRIQVDINKEKINADVKRGAENVQELIEKQKNNDQPKTTEVKSADKDAPASGAKLKDPAEPKKTTRAEDAFKGLITDGWFGGQKK